MQTATGQLAVQAKHGRVWLEGDALSVGVLLERREVGSTREVVQLFDERLTHAAIAVDDDGGTGAELESVHIPVDGAQLCQTDVRRVSQLE